MVDQFRRTELAVAAEFARDRQRSKK